VLDIKNNGITEAELERTKAQIKGGLYLGLESASSRMSRLGKTELTYNRVITPEEVVEKLERVTIEDIKRLMNRLWDKDKLSLVMMGPAGHEVDLQALYDKVGWK
jgi:predicted Zn-dependent peptidase